MANVVLRIETNPNASEEMLGTITNYDSADVGTNDNVSNTSIKANESGVYSGIENGSGEGSNGLSWAYEYENSEDNYLVFNDQDYLDNVENSDGYLESETNPTQFIWGVVPESKEYYVKLTFTNATKLKDIVVKGDTISNQFPTRAIIDGSKEIFSDDANWSIIFEEERDTHTIEFTHWNKANYNAVVSEIRIMLKYIDLDKYWLKDIESLSQSTATSNEIFYGVIANDGSANIVDVNGEILDIIKNSDISNSNLPCVIIANGNDVQHHIINNSKYDINAKVFSMGMTNSLALWDNINIGGVPLLDSCSAYELLVTTLATQGYTRENVDEMLSDIIIYGDNYEGTIKEYLDKIIIKYPYVKADTLRNTINKFCKLAQLQVYEDNYGKIKFRSARPVLPNDKTAEAIFIPKKGMQSKFVENIILKNKINSVGYSYFNTNYEYKSVYSAQMTFFKQTTIGTNFVNSQNEDESKYGYSGMFSDYQQEIGTNDKNCEIIGIYPTYEQGQINKSSRYAVFKATFMLNEVFREENPQWFIDLNSYNANVLPPSFAERPSNPSPNFLFNNSYTSRIIDSLSEDFILPYQYVNSESEARSNLIYNVNGQSALKSDSRLQIIRNGNSYTIFYAVNVTWNDSGSKEKYTGELQQIKLNGTVSIYLKAIVTDKITVLESADYTIPDNELIQAETFIDGTHLPLLLKQNILSDYMSGVPDAEVSVACINYKLNNGNEAKKWEDGQIIDVGDVVCFENSNNIKQRYWIVTGRNFRKKGVPLVDLELQEVKLV